MNNNPIGFFDSGIGGTSIWKEVIELLPNENSIYLCDTKNSPYGRKSKEDIIHICEKNTEYLLNNNSKQIVVACNTATTNAIAHLRNTYDVPFIGIEPAIKPASLVTKTNTIGILATKGTLDSELFEKTSNKIDETVHIISREGTGLVELIEAGKINSEEMTALLHNHLQFFSNSKIDALVLGCTHYPYLIPQIKKILGSSVSIIDSGKAVAKQTKAILIKYNLLNSSLKQGKHTLLTNGNIDTLKQVVSSVKNTDVREKNF